MGNDDTDNQIPPPEVLLRFAEEEEPRRVLDDYAEVIHTLREKNFTFREIAVWLQGHGFDVDHNAVWRAYAKTVPDHEAHLAAEADEKLELEEDHRDAMLNGTIVPPPTAAAEPASASAEPAVHNADKNCRRGRKAKKRAT